ncbi:MAG TPA: phage holin family protein [Candidatus Eisenbacteria bacterium]|nr:phage holin family protein [Candidatus Eisenbacteria bacterium]
MEEEEKPAPGLFSSLGRIGENILDAIRNRIEIFALELEEEKHWFISALLWTAATILFGTLAVIFVTFSIVLLFPEEARRWVLIFFCLLYVALAISAYCGLRKLLRDKPPPLSGTVGELKKDIEWIRSER